MTVCASRWHAGRLRPDGLFVPAFKRTQNARRHEKNGGGKKNVRRATVCTRFYTPPFPIARIPMTGEGGVILLSSTVFALVICKSALCTENDTNPPCLSPQTQAGGDGYLVKAIYEGV